MKKPKSQPGLPSRDQILRFIEDSPSAVGKREIAKHFALRGADKIALKALLRDMTDEGLVDMAPGRAFHKHGGLPRVTVFRVAAVEGDAVWAVPERWEASTPRSEEHTSELQSLMRISYAVFCLKKKTQQNENQH